MHGPGGFLAGTAVAIEKLKRSSGDLEGYLSA
jgi:hypothetical protein